MTSPTTRKALRNGHTLPLDEVPLLAPAEFRAQVVRSVERGTRLAAFFAVPGEGEALRMYAVEAHDSAGLLTVCATDVRDAYPALTPDCPQAHMFEREMAEQWGLRPEGHPWLKPVRFHPPYRPGHGPKERPQPSVTDYYRVEGEEIHEVAVGPVHAGVIEPGHFRFQCHGENVFHLEIALGYQHRGVERALVGGPDKRTVHYMETLAGDTSIGHATAYGHIVEGLSGCPAPARAHAWRAVALELERLANHTGDLGALAGDIGFQSTASFCGRIRGDFLNLTAAICGSRFGRGWVRPGGVAFDADDARVEWLLERLEEARRDVTHAVELLWNTSSVLARFEGAGPVSREAARVLGLVGPAARACGLERDVRVDYPTGIFGFAHIPVSTYSGGDVFARALVRWLEIQRSLAFLRTQLRSLPEGSSRTRPGALAPRRMAVSLVEGWRGEICHVALTDEEGRFAAYKVVDPSFHNWPGLAMALRGQAISDFPLCNKSFNLSYCGHDL